MKHNFFLYILHTKMHKSHTWKRMFIAALRGKTVNSRKTVFIRVYTSGARRRHADKTVLKTVQTAYHYMAGYVVAPWFSFSLFTKHRTRFTCMPPPYVLLLFTCSTTGTYIHTVNSSFTLCASWPIAPSSWEECNT